MTPSNPHGTPPHERLNVIALVSGGKDSFFSLLHCRANGHRVVALANLHPETPSAPDPEDGRSDEDEADLNSFMYQTVGHQVIPLYADATGIPLYRRPITGVAAQSGKEYSHASLHRPAGTRGDQQRVTTTTTTTPSLGGSCPSPIHPHPGDATADDGDETEAMIPLLRAVMAAHPEADALCAGAILSTYQRTRVESIASRLGLTPLAYLWKYTSLPPPAPAAASAPGGPGPEGDDDAQLLADMAAAGLEARLVKVATGGMDESFLWEDVAGDAGRARVRRAMRRFGGGGTAAGGAVLGEGGEFETLVLDGPRDLFGKKIVVEERDRHVVREGGGSAWLSIRAARVEDKGPPPRGEAAAGGGDVRIPDMLDARFASMLEELGAEGEEHRGDDPPSAQETEIPRPGRLQDAAQSRLWQWCVVGDVDCRRSSIETEASALVETARARLKKASLLPTSIISTVIVLRHMADFPTINKIYGSLFVEPNPPSRVTISSGDLLPPNCSIALYLSVHPGLGPGERQGLHVQSRSYWAPANIGPYSQAIAFPLSGPAGGAEPGASPAQLVVHIAGQIPLVPATMDLPPGGPEMFRLQLALSLQHLWRIGVEMGVQWWSSAVAFLPSDSSREALPTGKRAKLAAQAWMAAHSWSGGADADAEDSDAEGGPDLWDRKYNPRYMSFAEHEAPEPHCLPDWSVLLRAGEPAAKALPFVFAAEVQELPKQADVEWHAHSGLARLDAKDVRVVASVAASEPPARLQAQHTIVEVRGGCSLVHSVLVLKYPTAPMPEEKAVVPALLDELSGLLLRELASLTATDATRPAAHLPTLLYTDGNAIPLSTDDVQSCPVIPCVSLWNGQGERLLAVAVYQNFFEEAS